MATRRPPRKTANPPAPDAVLESIATPAEEASEEPSVQEPAETPAVAAEPAEPGVEAPGESGAGEPSPEPAAETATAQPTETAIVKSHPPRFHFFIIDSGWKSSSAKVIRDNFHMIREFQNDDPLYILTREQSIELIRANPELIGRDPMIVVHDLHAQGGRGDSGYHGFRLCLGLVKDSAKALDAMQEFLRFVHNHRRSADIEKDLKKKLHHAGLEGALEVIREGAGELME